MFAQTSSYQTNNNTYAVYFLSIANIQALFTPMNKTADLVVVNNFHVKHVIKSNMAKIPKKVNIGMT